MSTTVRLITRTALAVPFAAALSLGTGAAAHADEAVVPTVVVLDPAAITPVSPVAPIGPDDLTLEPSCDLPDLCLPEPDPEPDPEPENPVDPDLPEGPDDLTSDQGCLLDDPCDPGDPGDGGDQPEDQPDGGDQPEDQPEGGDQPQDEGEPEVGDDTGFDKPTRIDAGGLTPVVGGSASGTDGSQLGWLLPGGLLVGAAGAAGAARRIRVGQRA